MSDLLACRVCGIKPSHDLIAYKDGLANWLWWHIGTSHPARYRRALEALWKEVQK